MKDLKNKLREFIEIAFKHLKTVCEFVLGLLLMPVYLFILIFGIQIFFIMLVGIDVYTLAGQSLEIDTSITEYTGEKMCNYIRFADYCEGGCVQYCPENSRRVCHSSGELECILPPGYLP